MLRQCSRSRRERHTRDPPSGGRALPTGYLVGPRNACDAPRNDQCRGIGTHRPTSAIVATPMTFQYHRGRMLVALTLVAVITLGIFAYYLLAESISRRASEPEVSVRFLKTTHDFGDVAAGRVLRVTFQFVNNGALPVHIREIRRSCGCIATAAEKGECAPGATRDISVEMSTVGASAPLELDKTAVVTFVEQQIAPVTLEVIARLQPDVEVIPDRLQLSSRQTREPVTFQVRRRMLSELEFEHVLVSSADAHYFQIIETERSHDFLNYSVRLASCPASSQLPPLIVRHIGAEMRDLKTVFCEYRGGVAVPGAYVFVIDGRVNVADLPRLSRQRFSVANKCDKVTFAAISLGSNEVTSVVASDLQEGQPGVGHCSCQEFSIWVKKVPSDRVLKTFATIHYSNTDGSVKGTSTLPICVVRAD
jgi:hypothetical protein